MTPNDFEQFRRRHPGAVPYALTCLTLAVLYAVSALAGEAGTAATVKQGAVHEHATAKPERPNPTPILPKKEIP